MGTAPHRVNPQVYPQLPTSVIPSDTRVRPHDTHRVSTWAFHDFVIRVDWVNALP